MQFNFETVKFRDNLNDYQNDANERLQGANVSQMHSSVPGSAQSTVPFHVPA